MSEKADRLYFDIDDSELSMDLPPVEPDQAKEAEVMRALERIYRESRRNRAKRAKDQLPLCYRRRGGRAQ